MATSASFFCSFARPQRSGSTVFTPSDKSCDPFRFVRCTHGLQSSLGSVSLASSSLPFEPSTSPFTAVTHTCPPLLIPQASGFMTRRASSPLPLVSPAACTDALVTAHNSQAFPPMARDEQQKLLASGPVQGEAKEAMSGTDSADTAPVPPPSPCDYCSGMPAAVYCRADSARLCLPCDRHVHGANTVSSSHGRAPLCAVCLAAAAAFRCAALFLCSNCEFEKHRDDRAQGVPLHDRRTVEGYTGCPSVSELAAILGVDVECDKAANEGWWPVWEVPQVLSFDDVIVPTTSCHGFQPLLMPSSPKNRSSPGGELNEEVLRQLGELAKSEAAAYVEAEPAGDQLPSWASSEYAIGHGDFGAFGTETSHEAASMATPSYEHEAWIAIDCNDPTDACEAEVLREQVPVSSAAEPCLSSFVQISEICPSMSRNSSQDPATVDVPTQALPKKGGYDISYPDRGTVISRYREKRKNRRFGKQIRYESRKARADGRLRIKGRFAKSN